MKISFEQQANALKINLEGRLDAAGTGAVEAEFASRCAAKPNVIVDMSKVPFVASIGIRMLVAGSQAQSKIGGKMVLFKPDDATRRIFKTTGVDKLLPIHDDLNAVVAALGAK